MTARKSTRKRKPTADPLDVIANALTRPEVIGLILVLIAVLTMLSLLTSSTGAITGAWLAWLRGLFGVATWGFPVVLGALGLWMVIHAVEKMPDMPWQQPLGLGLLCLAGLIGTTLWVGPGSAGGGAIGIKLAETLRQVVGVGVAWAFVTLLTIVSVLLLTNRLLIDLAESLWESVQ
ncbi:MAG: DNA translocase FtsK 4TM domain-containing protein, partial [Caldilineaceae bacterium]|nr:DNA translocase FtsK 4TM domain-containing protein [Caldilineaceae bacterium]